MGLIVPMIVKGALGRNDLLNGNNSFYRIQPPINDLGSLMNSSVSGYGYGMNSPLSGGSFMNSSAGGFIAGAAVGAAAMGVMQNGGNNFIDHPQNNGYNNQPNNGYQNNGYNNQPNNGYQNNGYNNQPNNGYQNNGYNNQPNNGYQNNGYNNQPNNGYQNNGYNNQQSGNYGVQQPVNTAAPAYSTRPQQTVNNPVPSNPPRPQTPPQPQMTQPSPPPAPAFKRNRVQPTGDILSKGQKYQVKGADGRPATNLKICFGWDVTNPQCEVDASAFMLGENDRVPGEEWFIFYGQPADPYRVVQYRVYKDDRSSPDDASIELELDKVAPFINKIALAVTIYESGSRGHNFGMVKNLYARIIDMNSGREVACFKMNECNSSVTAMVLGELYRYKGEWKFNAVGSGVNKDLAEFCGMYGIELA